LVGVAVCVNSGVFVGQFVMVGVFVGVLLGVLLGVTETDILNAI
jgi:hypothetical protein